MKNYRKALSFSLIVLLLAVCGTPAALTAETPGSCTFSKADDLLIIRNSAEKYELQIYLYGSQITDGAYQILNDGEPELEGTLIKGGISRDVKTTLHVECSGNHIKAYGKAQLYKINSIHKSGEILNFEYDGAFFN